eukprot:CAMPEP_0179034228 /NCGR_PEP_ID=MMETSP0796-20121207/12502_1 /TAXON_ID=73915 /ORGANISM="Pyrodinium bahamense, Strain pbaha01" /LENGTH=311 /DNA_ID=CAMNT_0020730493 /DNA_START=89 /DNA_END=1025 /DNA_ORIENTATION=+
MQQPFREDDDDVGAVLDFQTGLVHGTIQHLHPHLQLPLQQHPDDVARAVGLRARCAEERNRRLGVTGLISEAVWALPHGPTARRYGVEQLLVDDVWVAAVEGQRRHRPDETERLADHLDGDPERAEPRHGGTREVRARLGDDVVREPTKIAASYGNDVEPCLHRRGHLPRAPGAPDSFPRQQHDEVARLVANDIEEHVQVLKIVRVEEDRLHDLRPKPYLEPASHTACACLVVAERQTASEEEHLDGVDAADGKGCNHDAGEVGVKADLNRNVIVSLLAIQHETSCDNQEQVDADNCVQDVACESAPRKES